MFGAESARLFRKRRKLDAVRSLNIGASISTTAVSESMAITSEDDRHLSIEDVSELMHRNMSRIDAMQNHWHAVDERFNEIFKIYLWPNLQRL